MEWSADASKCVEVNLCLDKDCGDNATCNASGECSCDDGYELGTDNICVKVEGGDPACEDDTLFTFDRDWKDSKTKLTFCKWINSKPQRIDTRRFKFCYANKLSTCEEPSHIGLKCKKACGFCDPDQSHLSACTTLQLKCKDSEEFQFSMIRKNKMKGCSWITKNFKRVAKRRSIYCLQKEISLKCPLACKRKLCEQIAG